MREFADRPYETSAPRLRRRSLKISRLVLPAALVAASALAGLVGFDLYAPPPATIEATSQRQPVALAAVSPYSRLLDPGYALGVVPPPLERGKPSAKNFRLSAPQLPAPPRPVESAAISEVAPRQLALPPLSVERPKVVETMRLPAPRPSDLRLPAEPERPRVATPQPQRRTKSATLPATPEDNRSFFEKLFGVQRSSGTALAYAAPQDDIVDAGRGRRLSPLLVPPTSTAQATAVYDISSRTVHMPNGDKLEAHSGLGEHMDDPRYAHLRMRGATPPHTYNLTMREAPFHGVRALRLNPVGGSGAIHGRDGLLAHTYLLGPNGDSNGCVSFKDYDKFLQAYLRGEVKRLIVVASRS